MQAAASRCKPQEPQQLSNDQLQVSDSVKAYLEVLELPRPMTAGFKAVLHVQTSAYLS